MFASCQSLESLNLSLFDISQVSEVDHIFFNCVNLKYINLEKAFELESLNNENMFQFVSDGITYCINEEKAPKISALLQEINHSKKDCSLNWKEELFSTGISTYDDNICIAKDFFEGTCKMNNSNIEEKEIIGQNIIDNIMDGSMDNILKNIINNNSNYIIKEEKQIYQISTVSHQKENTDNSMTVVDLGKCEKVLKKANGIDETEELIIFKINNYIPGFNIPIIEYVIFNENGRKKLNLSYCDETPIQYYIPVSINESELYKYDATSIFYTEGCFQYTSEYGTDMTLYDRKNEYNNNNFSLCEVNCEFKGYNSTTLKVECECKIKNNINFFSDINIDTNELINRFISIKKIANIWVVKCYHLVFSLKGIKTNIGSYILLIIILINITLSILFWKIGYSLLFNKMKEIADKKFSCSSDEKKVNIPPKKKGKKRRRSSRISNQQNDILIQTNPELIEKEIEKVEKNENEMDNKEKTNFNDYELNSLSYEEAIKFDNRSYWEYYLSLIRTKQLIVFTFYTYSDYNSKIIKISLFFFAFALFYIINALFFNDTTMHQIYEDKGVFNFLYQIPQILYSTIISVAIKTILNILSLTEKNIIEIKNQKTYVLAHNVMKKKQKILLIKFILFFIFSFLFLGLFWYYISSFCAVYKNTQLYLIEDTAISFGISLIYPFAISLIPGFLRIHSLKNKNKACLYRISKIIQLI